MAPRKVTQAPENCADAQTPPETRKRETEDPYAPNIGATRSPADRRKSLSANTARNASLHMHPPKNPSETHAGYAYAPNRGQKR